MRYHCGLADKATRSAMKGLAEGTVVKDPPDDPSARFWMAYDGFRLVGSAGWVTKNMGRWFWLRTDVVHKDYRRRGVYAELCKRRWDSITEEHTVRFTEDEPLCVSAYVSKESLPIYLRYGFRLMPRITPRHDTGIMHHVMFLKPVSKKVQKS